MTASGRTAQRQGLWESRVTAEIWRFFTSIRLALFLILTLTVLILIGTLLMQVPPSVQANEASYAQWLGDARSKYGIWTDLFERLQFFNVFRALYFRALISLLAVNIIVCSLNRWSPIWTTVFKSRVRMTDSFFEHARFRARYVTPDSLEDATAKLRRSLRRGRFKVTADRREGSNAVLADKNRLSVFGTFLTHLSLVLILIGAVLGGLFGFKDDAFIVAEGATESVAGTDLSIRLEHFADEYWIAGPPKDFRSEVTLLNNGEEVRETTIRVNSPLRYRGITFYQSFFGQVAILKVQNADGDVILEEAVPLAYRTREGERPIGGAPLPGSDVTAWIIGPRSGENDPLIKAGQMRIELADNDRLVAEPATLTQGDPVELGGMTFTFERESRFTGLKVVKDPGVNIIWIASTLLVLGMVMLFYFPRRRAWALLTARPDGHTDVRIAMPAQRDLSPASEFNRLQSRVVRALRATPDEPDHDGQGDSTDA